MEKEIKNLKIQLHELNTIIHGTNYEIDRLEKEIIPLEIEFQKLKKNKNFLKEESLIVTISGYKEIKEELFLIEAKLLRKTSLLNKYKAYMESLVVREDALLNRIDEINEELNKIDNILIFDLKRKNNDG